MQKLVSSSDLFVMQTEFSIYVLLRFWVFLHLHPEWESSSRESVLEAQQYFQNRKGDIRSSVIVIYKWAYWSCIYLVTLQFSSSGWNKPSVTKLKGAIISIPISYSRGLLFKSCVELWLCCLMLCMVSSFLSSKWINIKIRHRYSP